MADKRALVIGGGGVAGIAWANGIVAGLAESGVDVRDADVLIGTSAGSNVTAQVSSGLTPEKLFARQVDPALQSKELVPEGNPIEGIWEKILEIQAETEGNPAEARRRLCALAMTVHSVPVAARRAVIESRLPVHEWPRQPLLITVVNAETGEPRTFDRDSGVSLVDAVTASSAVPLVWPCHIIDGVHYTDGGVRTSVNADLAVGYERVLVIAPLPDEELEQQIATLTEKGARVEVISPDEASFTAFGANPLDTVSRVPSANAGRDQGKSVAAQVATLWS
ncbi:MAG: patatin-like phospholipase [Nocardia sp.]|uniref:patatin-like phospholipase family protein n=1 Tax=Nocardia sp. TaxID=1821 RepID=UPI00261657AF|nr:patatin-like phospholipase family protein [Nocardia sp.]MCU1641931.1 patatin-like phospholipase [Nocardia sp.]